LFHHLCCISCLYFPSKILYAFLICYSCAMLRMYLTLLHVITFIIFSKEHEIRNSYLGKLLSVLLLPVLDPHISITPYSKTLNVCLSYYMRNRAFHWYKVMGIIIC
jgi:hypothetical protein